MTNDKKNKVLQNAVMLAKNGDMSEFDTIYKQTYKLAYYYVNRKMTNYSETNDIVQEIYITVYKNISKLNNSEAFLPWFIKIVGRTTINYSKKHKANLPEPVDSSEYEEKVYMSYDELSYPEKALQMKHVQSELKEVIDTLPEKQKSVLIYTYFSDLTIPEIAELTGDTNGVLSKRLFDAKLTLKKKLSNSKVEFNVFANMDIGNLVKIHIELHQFSNKIPIETIVNSAKNVNDGMFVVKLLNSTQLHNYSNIFSITQIAILSATTISIATSNTDDSAIFQLFPTKSAEIINTVELPVETDFTILPSVTEKENYQTNKQIKETASPKVEQTETNINLEVEEKKIAEPTPIQSNEPIITYVPITTKSNELEENLTEEDLTEEVTVPYSTPMATFFEEPTPILPSVTSSIDCYQNQVMTKSEILQKIHDLSGKGFDISEAQINGYENIDFSKTGEYIIDFSLVKQDFQQNITINIYPYELTSIVVTNTELTYSVGNIIPKEKVLSDIRPEILSGDQTATIKLFDYEKIDFMETGFYFVYIGSTNDEIEISPRKAIIIKII